MHTKMKFNESIEFSDGALNVPMHTSGRLVGRLTINEYDAYGRKIFSSTEENDITLPGSIFVLEQMFKVKANKRFLHKNKLFPIGTAGSGEYATKDGWNEGTDIPLKDEKIFGFMVGNGGEEGSGVIAPKYESTMLADNNGAASFLPFQIIKSGQTFDEQDKYCLSYNDIQNKKTYYYVKKFDTTTHTEGASISSKWADGSGDVSEDEITSYSSPILTYAECVLTISATDLRDYFGESNIDHCAINQLGLVSGYYNSAINDWDDVKLVTCVNFKSRDLSNSENRLQITYKIYCL